MTGFDDLVRAARTSFDLTDPRHRKSLDDLTARLLEGAPADLDELRRAARAEKAPLEFRLAAKLVDSRRFVETIDRPLRVAVVFAMWGEHNRLLTRSDDNPHGEDSLRTKLDQLECLSRGTELDCGLFAVDDGCPHGSARIAREIAGTLPHGDRVTVLELGTALPVDEGPLAELASADDSRKAGAIVLGCMKALEQGYDAVVYTDADNSVHLGQLGLLLRPFVEQEARVVIGDRKHADAVLVKQEARWGQGIVILRHMQRMVGQALYSRGINDTQAAFKLYEASLLKEIITRPTVFDFSFDSDWLLAALVRDIEPVRVPFAFIDSAAESASITQGPMTTWEALLKGLVKAVRRHAAPHDADMARVIDEVVRDHRDLDAIIDTLPPALADAPADRLGDPTLMPPTDVEAWIKRHRSN